MGSSQGTLSLCWLALARVRIGSVKALEYRHRDRSADQAPMAVQGSVRPIGRFEVGAGISSIRAAYHPEDNTIGLGWFKRIKRWRKPQSTTLRSREVHLLERGGDIVIAAAFTSEAEARVWLKARHAYTLPSWEPK